MNTCRCGNPVIIRNTFRFCTHCDQPCDTRNCGKCEVLKRSNSI